MEDVAFIVILIAFFGLMALFVKACDWIIGSDEEALADRGTAPNPVLVSDKEAA